jgi:hypothetical protein
MLGPTPYKNLPPITSDTRAPTPTIDGVAVPSDLKISSSELISLAEAPEVLVPSTYDEALRNDEVLSNAELIDENNIQVFPSNATKEEIAFGTPIPTQTDVGAFGGGVGTSTAPGLAKVDTAAPLTTDEKTVLVQNSVLVETAGVTGTGETYELGTKLPESTSTQKTIQSILATKANLEPVDTDIIEVQEFVVPDAPSIVDGGEF